MQRIDLKLGKRGYPILIGPGLLGSRELFSEHAPAARLLVVTDEVVAPLWLSRLEQGLAGRAFAKCVLPGGEEQKTLFNVAAIIDALVAARLNRDGMVLAPASRRPPTSAASPTCSCRPRCSHRWIRQSAARPASITPAART
jgi:3-dehydroquinate synthase